MQNNYNLNLKEIKEEDHFIIVINHNHRTQMKICRHIKFAHRCLGIFKQK